MFVTMLLMATEKKLDNYIYKKLYNNMNKLL